MRHSSSIFFNPKHHLQDHLHTESNSCCGLHVLALMRDDSVVLCIGTILFCIHYHII